jgi:ABC-2 type transport system permease protein
VRSFGTALRVEVRKTLTTRMWWILLLVMAAYVAVIAGFLAIAFSQEAGTIGGPPTGALDDETQRRVLYTLVMPLAYVFPVLVGTLSITAEYRYQTLTPTFLAEPRRSVVLVAKLVVATVLGLLFGLVGATAGAGAVAGVRVLTGDPPGLDGEIVQALAQVVLGMGLWAAVGVGVGSLVRNQVAAVVVIIAFSQLVEPIARVALSAWDATRSVSQYLPGAAGDAMAGASLYTLGSPVELLPWWQGALVLAGYAVVLFALGSRLAVRRDVA